MIHITTRYITAVERRFTLYQAKLEDWPLVWAEVQAAFGEMETLWFETEGQGTWRELDEDYAMRKANEFPGQPILVRTGDLKEAAEEPNIDILGNSMTIRIDNPYAEYHQEGRGVPQRRVIPPLPQTRAMVHAIAEAHVRLGP